jgi:predicted ATPase/DNA-binding winged helix-turn-helix (wHTH) protein
LIDVATQGEVTFGPFTLTPSERRLTRDGAVVPLGGRTLDILTALVASASRPLSKQELMSLVWPDVIVGEASLRFHVANLRKALGDGENGARYISTFSGRGYCFVAPVSHPEPPPARPTAPTSWTGNLPSRPPLIGRDGELAEIAGLLAHERLVTIVGPGGVGKTRLAIAAGWRTADDFPDGVWLVDLAPLSDPSLVVSAVATALDLTRGGGQLSAALIASTLRDRRLLLILDNCEHLVGASAALTETLIEGAPGLTILATSQESLRLDAERVYQLDPLALPPQGADDIARYGAADLFAHRARAVDRRFELSGANAPTVTDICRRLDGMPLALEMAAARVPSLGLEGLRASLEARLQVLSAGLRTSDVRHQTLRGAVAWSIGLLDETEAVVFRRLGVFSGGCSLESAAAVVAAGELDRWVVADALARLVDKSVVVLERTEPARYRLLETLRLYAQELIEASGEQDRLAEYHARHVRLLFAPARQAWQTTPEPEWQAIYLPERDNFRSALGWALADPGRFDLAVELTASAGFMWYEWGLVDEGRRTMMRVIAGLDDSGPSVSAAAILRDAADLLGLSAQYDEALALVERAAATSRRVGDDLGLARANIAIANLRMRQGRPPSEAAALMVGVCATLSAGGHKRSLSGARIVLGNIARQQQDFAEAVDNFNLAVELAGELKNVRQAQAAMLSLASTEFSRGDIERAIALGRETVNSSRPLPQRTYIETALENLASFLLAADRIEETRAVAEEALALVRARGETVDLLRNLQQWALIAAREGREADAARLVGWVDAAYGRLETRRNTWEAASYERLLSQLKTRLSETELGAFAADGARWDTDRAVYFAFDRIVRRQPVQRA